MALMISSLVDLPVSVGELLLVVAVGEALLVVTVEELVMGESWLLIFVAHILEILLVPGFLCVFLRTLRGKAPCFDLRLSVPICESAVRFPAIFGTFGISGNRYHSCPFR